MDMASHYLRCLELCKKLNNQFDIMIANSERFGNFIKRLNIETFETENFDPEEIVNATVNFDFSWINRENIERVLYSQINTIQEYEPDFVLGDTSLPLKIASEKTDTTFISLLNGYMTKYYRLTRNVSRNHPGYEYSDKMPAIIFNLLVRLIEYVSFRKIHKPFRLIRKELSLSSQHYFLDELEGYVNLICDLPDFFPQKKHNKNYHFIGPLFYRGNDCEEEIIEFIGDHNPNILVSMGSTGNWEKISFLNDSIFEEFKIIVSNKDNPIMNRSNTLSRSFINHTAILDMIDIVICHGGNGTIYQALSHGVPVLCITNNFEQEWNSQRIEELELGTLINDTSDVMEIRRIIDFWINRKRSNRFLKIKQRISDFLNKPIYLRNLLKN